jgi:hypothetical protein
VIPLKYDWVGNFYDGIAVVKLGDKEGWVTREGEEVVPPKYDWVGNFYDGIAEVKLGDKEGWVTREGKELLLSKDKHIQIKNLIELEKITEEELINWVKERAV